MDQIGIQKVPKEVPEGTKRVIRRHQRGRKKVPKASAEGTKRVTRW
jgi:hypothetical protein